MHLIVLYHLAWDWQFVDLDELEIKVLKDLTVVDYLCETPLSKFVGTIPSLTVSPKQWGTAIALRSITNYKLQVQRN